MRPFALLAARFVAGSLALACGCAHHTAPPARVAPAPAPLALPAPEAPAPFALRSGTGALADPRATAPLVRIAPVGLDGQVQVLGLELRPNGDRAVLLAPRAALDLGTPTATTPVMLALFTPAGASRGLFSVPCWSNAVAARDDAGTVYVACLAPTAASSAGSSDRLALAILGPDDTAPRGAQLAVETMRDLTGFAAGPDGSLWIAGRGRNADALVQRVSLGGRAHAHRSLGRLGDYGPRLASLPGGDVIAAAGVGTGGAGGSLSVRRLAASNLATRWEQTLRAADAGYPLGPFASLAVDARSGQLYVGTTLAGRGRSSGLFALGPDDGAVRWQRSFGEARGGALDALAATPDGGALVVLQLEAGSNGPVALEFANERFRNERAYDHDLVLGWVGPDGTPRRAERWEMHALGRSASVAVFPRLSRDGRAVIAANFYRALLVRGRSVEAPSRTIPCPADSVPCGHGDPSAGASKRKQGATPPPEPRCCEPRTVAPSAGVLVSLE